MGLHEFFERVDWGEVFANSFVTVLSLFLMYYGYRFAKHIDEVENPKTEIDSLYKAKQDSLYPEFFEKSKSYKEAKELYKHKSDSLDRERQRLKDLEDKFKTN